MKKYNSLWLIAILLWGAITPFIFLKQVKPLDEKNILTTTIAEADGSGPVSHPVAMNAKTGTGIITSLTFGQFYSADEITHSITSFFGSYTHRIVQWPVQSFNLTFTSRDFDSTPVTIHAQVFVPITEQTAELPVYVFAAGTTGIGDLCAPSLEQPAIRRWGWYRENMLAYASQGYLVILPDYTGFNDASRPQRYFSKYAEGHMMLDAIRAIEKFPGRSEVTGIKAKVARAVFLAGYSQGGHAAFAAADLHADYAPDVPLTGIINYGGTNDIAALMREGVAYTPLVLYSYMMMYGSEHINPADYLQPAWIPTFEHDASTMSVDVFQRYYGFDSSRLYTPEFLASLEQGTLDKKYPGLARLLARNNTGFSGHKLPALIIQGNDDFIVTDKTQIKFVNRLQSLGSEVQLHIFPHVSHKDTRAAGFETTLAWMEAQLLKLGISPWTQSGGLVRGKS